jgi:hypothetical protein
MMADFSARDSLAVAVEKTFDGEHPCPMCIKIRADRAEEQRSKSTDSGVAAPRAPDASPPPDPVRIPFVSCAPALHRSAMIGCPEPPVLPPLTPPPQRSSDAIPAFA